MAVFNIRTAWGPKAKADARAHELAVLKAEEKLALEQEFTKQITKGDADVAAAVMGIAPAPAEKPLVDLSDPMTQAALGIAAIAAAYAAKRYMG